MRPYLAVFSARFRMLLQYRAAAIAGFGTQLFWGLIRMMIFTGFFHSSTTAQPMTLSDTITYIWLGQAFLLLIPWNWDHDIAAMIRNGNVAFELVRPVKLYWFWFSRALAMRIVPVLLRSIPMFIVAGIFFKMKMPLNMTSAIAFLITLAFAFILSAAITVLTNISMLWTISGQGFSRVFPIMIYFFSGLVVPLPFYPDWAQTAVKILPFRGLIDIPFRLYLGHLPVSSLLSLVFHQIIWIIVFILIGRTVLAQGLKKVVVQGG